MFRLLFVPWPEEGEGHYLKNDAEDWQTAAATEVRNKKFFRIVYARPNPGIVASLALTGLGSTDTVYVMGHCDAGLDYLVSRSGGSGEKLPHNLVCDRLIAHGLQPWFSGKLKFFNCNSGVQGVSTPSFLSLAGKYLRDKGYTACTIYGYSGITGGYGKTVGGGINAEPPHKSVFQLVPSTNNQYSFKRARDGQVIY